MAAQTGWSDDEKKSIRNLLASLGPYREIRKTMPLQYVTAFLLVAEEEGLGVNDYAKRAGISMSVMSRHLLDIGMRNRNMKEGFGLLSYWPNPMELRKHEYVLTPKGRQLLKKMFSALSR